MFKYKGRNFLSFTQSALVFKTLQESAMSKNAWRVGLSDAF